MLNGTNIKKIYSLKNLIKHAFVEYKIKTYFKYKDFG